jgi:hypothetical protein
LISWLFLSRGSKSAKDGLENGVGKKFSSSSLAVVEPDSEEALGKGRERNKSENKVEWHAENSK